MISKEQLDLAQQISDACQDYITLARAQAKLKDKNKAQELAIIIENTTNEINEKARAL